MKRKDQKFTRKKNPRTKGYTKLSTVQLTKMATITAVMQFFPRNIYKKKPT